MNTSKIAAFLMVCVLGSPVFADYLEPPVYKPAWWKVPGDPEDGVSRTLYRSFITQPWAPDDAPDYTYNGYQPSRPDTWTQGLQLYQSLYTPSA
ncbi:unnamed protein product, partial [marine sediment metagenome]